jgi:uncharacterized protein
MIKRILAGPILILLACLPLFFLTGCGGHSRSARFYVLSPMELSGPEAENLSPINRDITIGIFPVSLPKYLRKPQIVTRSGSNELQLAEFHRWAGKMEEDIGRVVAEDLSTLLGTDKVLSYTAMEPLAFDYTIKMDIIRFDGRLGGDLELIVRWAVLDRQGNTVHDIQATHITEPVNGLTYAEMIGAQSRALARYSRNVAEVIKKLAHG